MKESILSSQTTADTTKVDGSNTKADKPTDNDASNGGKLSRTNIQIYITGVAIGVCVFFYRGGGKSGNVVVPEKINASVVKRQNIL